jgi:hypothetical protein
VARVLRELFGGRVDLNRLKSSPSPGFQMDGWSVASAAIERLRVCRNMVRS